ncbi:phosphocarrier protein NPr [Marinospirillum celere]|uniref:Phosphocarrier protein NPr n=1 Tax=Marinospirillum celere TaxID=1122252 RepID=A0A1I1FXL7_9GAMM|nr:HPr family phosphocarrier protein [Marinospirillum celere]SFC03796.1 phosphocarrier protein NPr [Marinospirillum celere]
MPEKTVTLINKKGLHARAATRLVHLSQKYNCQIELCLGDKIANTRNIMQLLMLAAPCGTQLLLRAQGDDAEAALCALDELIQARFDEEE